MNPGRELDALVAEKVMGLDLSPKIHPYKKVSDFSLRPGALNYYGTYVEKREPEFYSTDIAAAWEVVEKMRSHSHMDAFALKAPDEDQAPGFWRAIFLKKEIGPEDMSNFYEWPTLGCSAPHAICLAALKACGIEIPK